MSIRLQNEVEALAKRVEALERDLAEALALLRAMTRASTPKAEPKGRAA